MFSCNRLETQLIMEGRASGVARKYGKDCPHVVGAELVLTSDTLDGSGRHIPFARATVTSVRPGTVGQFRKDKIQAEKDGYQSGEHWYGNLRQMYRGLNDTDKMHHISFLIIEIDKQAGQRDEPVDG
ncbi:MAG: hypothetical protein JW704_10345 [Anaerolineaceae bacterium]|nr:hypothetical protein [Anaerolineaceae bacterium]